MMPIPTPPRTSRRRSRDARRRGGVAAVEFAIVANVLFLLIFTCVEFARVSMIRNLAQDAAYFAARTAMVPGGTEEDAIDEANRILGVMRTRGATVAINDGNGLDDASTEVRVVITVPLGRNTLFVPRFVGNADLRAEATLRTERYDGFFDGG